MDLRPAELPPDVRAWIRDEAADVVLVLDFLRRNPFEYGTLLTLARLEREPEIARWLPETPGYWQLLDDATARIERFIAAASVGACIRCLSPIVMFPDGRSIDWPGLDRHMCEDIADVYEREALADEMAARHPVPAFALEGDL